MRRSPPSAGRRHELLRVAFADLVGGMGIEAVGRSLSDIAEATIEVGLEIAIRSVEHATGSRSPPRSPSSAWAASAAGSSATPPMPTPSWSTSRTRGLRGGGPGGALAVVQELIRLLAVPGAEPRSGSTPTCVRGQERAPGPLA